MSCEVAIDPVVSSQPSAGQDYWPQNALLKDCLLFTLRWLTLASFLYHWANMLHREKKKEKEKGEKNLEVKLKA